MKKNGIGKFLTLSLILCVLGVSCGSSNETDGETTSNSTIVTNPNITTTTTGSNTGATANSRAELRNIIATNAFATENGAEVFLYQKCTLNVSEFLWVDWTTSDCSSSFTRRSTNGEENIVHELASTKAGLINVLLAKIDNYSYTYTFQSSTVHILTNTASGEKMVFNLNQPLAANPIWSSTSSELYQLSHRYPYY